MARPILLLLPLFLAGCTASPLYVGGQTGTVGEIPRDGRGEPLWGAIGEAQPLPPTAEAPPTFAAVAPADPR